MSGLKLRASWGEGVLRSIGDAPNGTIGIAMPDGEPTLTVDRHHQPGESRLERTKTGINLEHSTPVTIDDAITACEDSSALVCLAEIVLNTVGAGMAYLIQHAAFEEARRMCDFAEEVNARARDEFERRRG